MALRLTRVAYGAGTARRCVSRRASNRERTARRNGPGSPSTTRSGNCLELLGVVGARGRLRANVGLPRAAVGAGRGRAYVMKLTHRCGVDSRGAALSGLVAILAHETGRYSEFWSGGGLDLPTAHVKALYGSDIAFGRNNSSSRPRSTTWTGSVLRRRPDLERQADPAQLLARDVDIVSQRSCGGSYRSCPWCRASSTEYVPLTMEELGTTGLAQVDACGMAGRWCAEGLGDRSPAPWFTVGALQPDKIGETSR